MVSSVIQNGRPRCVSPARLFSLLMMHFTCVCSICMCDHRIVRVAESDTMHANVWGFFLVYNIYIYCLRGDLTLALLSSVLLIQNYATYIVRDYTSVGFFFLSGVFTNYVSNLITSRHHHEPPTH